MPRSGEKEGSQLQHHPGCYRQQGMKKGDKRSVDTLIYNIVSRLRQWGDVERGGGREVEMVGSKFGLSQIPPAANLTKLYLPCQQKVKKLFVTSLQTFLLTFVTTLYRLFVNFFVTSTYTFY